MLVTPVAVHEQWNASVVGGENNCQCNKSCAGFPGTVTIVIKHVHLNSCCTYLRAIKHLHKRAFFCYSIKSGTHLSTYRYEGDVTS